MSFRWLVALCLVHFLIACTNTQVIEPENRYELAGRGYLYQKKAWSFVGRLALKDESNSLSAAINWQHQEGLERIELSGPFGQGRTIIEITDNNVLIDDGDHLFNYPGQVDQVVSNRVGMVVPVSALKFWVLGLVDPDQRHVLLEKGFIQSNWQVNFSQMQWVGENNMPRKIKIANESALMKIVFQQWNL